MFQCLENRIDMPPHSSESWPFVARKLAVVPACAVLSVISQERNTTSVAEHLNTLTYSFPTAGVAGGGVSSHRCTVPCEFSLMIEPRHVLFRNFTWHTAVASAVPTTKRTARLRASPHARLQPDRARLWFLSEAAVCRPAGGPRPAVASRPPSLAYEQPW